MWIKNLISFSCTSKRKRRKSFTTPQKSYRAEYSNKSKIERGMLWINDFLSSLSGQCTEKHNRWHISLCFSQWTLLSCNIFIPIYSSIAFLWTSMFSSIKVIALTTKNNIFVCDKETVVEARYSFFFYLQTCIFWSLILC